MRHLRTSCLFASFSCVYKYIALWLKWCSSCALYIHALLFWCRGEKAGKVARVCVWEHMGEDREGEKERAGLFIACSLLWYMCIAFGEDALEWWFTVGPERRWRGICIHDGAETSKVPAWKRARASVAICFRLRAPPGVLLNLRINYFLLLEYMLLFLWCTNRKVLCI